LESNGRPVAFASRALNPAEKRYSTLDKELLAIVWSIDRFKYYLTGISFTVATDHRPLLHVATMTCENARRRRWTETLMRYNPKIKHIKGRVNSAADALSRNINAISLQSSSLMDQVRHEQQQDPETRKLMEATRKEPGTSRLAFRDNILVDNLNGCARTVLPATFRQQILHQIHTSLGHPGTTRMIDAVNCRYIWPGYAKDVRSFCEQCKVCQQSKVTRHNKPQPLVFNASSRFEVIHMDLVGSVIASPLGSTYILTIIDKFSRWPELIP